MVRQTFNGIVRAAVNVPSLSEPLKVTWGESCRVVIRTKISWETQSNLGVLLSVSVSVRAGS